MLILCSGIAGANFAQPARQQPVSPARSVQAQSSSSINSHTEADGEQIVEIRNVSYEITGTDIPGRPRDQRLLLRKTTRSKQTLGDIGQDATVTLEAWRWGDDPRQKPLYAVTASGTDGHTMDNAIFIASRGLEEVEWWSIYKLGTGQHLFDSYVPLLSFSISREILTTRYVGLEAPPDDTRDARLKQPNVVAVLTYASEDRVIREALLTADDPRRAVLLRSYADVTRSVSMSEEAPTGAPAAAKKAEPSRVLKILFRENYPSPPNPVELAIPIQNDDLDLAHARLPAGIRAAIWRR